MRQIFRVRRRAPDLRAVNHHIKVRWMQENPIGAFAADALGERIPDGIKSAVQIEAVIFDLFFSRGV